jgi:protein-L-isoaspartate O-methyltransferase
MSHNDRTFRVSEVHKLEDPERLQWLPVDDVISALALRSEMTVADIGAGTGYFAIPIARVVRRVYADEGASDCAAVRWYDLRS